MDLPNIDTLSKIKILLLEGISKSAVAEFQKWGLKNVDSINDAPSAESLVEIIPNYHVIGIRSRTKLTPEVIKKATKLAAVGCFCIGTDQVDLKSLKQQGVPAYNAPYSNTRSVAELAICCIISLFRKVHQRNLEIHSGIWQKSAIGCHEVRNKTLGIIGYGHIGKQLGHLAENLGMRVIYYDIANQLSLGNAQPAESLAGLLSASDIVSLHVPDNELARNLINKKNISLMPAGSYLINLARGAVVNIEDLKQALDSGHLAGAALDVFPVEPSGNNVPFSNPLSKMPNVLLTPHIAGSTVEAQDNIGKEVAQSLSQFIRSGSTMGAVNFVNIKLPEAANCTRFIHIHFNVPGMLAKINEIFGSLKLNILGQYLQTDAEIGYTVIDSVTMTQNRRQTVKTALRSIPHTIKAYCIY